MLLVTCGLRSAGDHGDHGLLADRYPAVAAVEAGVQTRARLQLQHLFAFVKRPDARKGGVEVFNDRRGALVQDLASSCHCG